MRGVDVGTMMLALALAGPGCFSPAPAAGLPCSPTGECPAGQTCNMTTTPPTCDGIASPADAADDVADATRPPDAQSCSAGCPAEAPICDPETDLCRGCIADVECPTGACFESDGTCVAQAAVLYVAPGGADNQCDRMAPCGSIAAAIGLASPTRAFVALAPGKYQDNLLTWPMHAVTLSGPDLVPETARIEQATAMMPIVDVPLGAGVVFEGLTVTGAIGAIGILCKGQCTLRRVVSSYHSNRGFDVWSTATVLVEDSRFEHNASMGIDANGSIVMTRSIMAHNGDTGLDMSNGFFDITNSFVFSNGNGTLDGGGVEIKGSVAPGSRFAFNTVVDNFTATMGEGGGLECEPAMGTVVITNSIFARNSAPNARAAGGCSATYVLTSAGAVMGTGNLVADPMFVDEMGEDFHITNASPARGAADPAADLASDCDGEVRPTPAGSPSDVGADEVP